MGVVCGSSGGGWLVGRSCGVVGAVCGCWVGGGGSGGFVTAGGGGGGGGAVGVGGVGEVQLVAHEPDDDAGGGLALELRDPVFGFDERGGFGEVVDDEGGLGVAVVHGCEGGEALLARGVPDFEFDGAGWEGGFLS